MSAESSSDFDTESIAELQDRFREANSNGALLSLVDTFNRDQLIALIQSNTSAKSISHTTGEDSAVSDLARLELGKRLREPDETDLIFTYLRFLCRERLHLALAQLDVGEAVAGEAKQLQLPSIYTELITGNYYIDGRKSDRGDHLEARDLEIQLSASAFAAHYKKAVVLGDPGSGKSTFTDMLTYCLAGDMLGAETGNTTLLPDWRNPVDPAKTPRIGLIPLHIVLREYAGFEGSIWEFLQERLDSSPLRKGTADVIEHLLRTEGGVLILDGLDEVPEAEQAREGLFLRVQEFSIQFPEVRILVTSRPYAFEEENWRQEGFNSTKLQPFNAEQRTTFITQWFAHCAPRKKIAEAAAEKRRDALIHAVENRRNLTDLGENPLLLTMICLLDLVQGGGVPENREELYESAINLLLEIWQKPVMEIEGAASLQEYIGVQRSDVLGVIEKLAFGFHNEQGDKPGLADIPRRDVVDALFELCEDPQNTKATDSGILRFIQDRAGLLNDHGGKVFRFPHRTFQEYLAARHLSDMPSDIILSYLQKDPRVKWREPFLLAGAKIGRGSEGALLDLLSNITGQLPDEANEFTETQWRITLLGLELLYDRGLHHKKDITFERHKETRATLIKNAVSLIEHPSQPLTNLERQDAGLLLGRVGDPRSGVGCDENGTPEIDWVKIEKGPFLFGNENEKAIIAEDFEISRYPITIAQYAAFVKEQKKDWLVGEHAEQNLPATEVSWHEAMAFCAWLTSKSADRIVTLPTEKQWERAARGTDAQEFPWGKEEQHIEKRCNMADSEINNPSIVGLFPSGKTPVTEIFDMSGNVWEWCQDEYQSNAKNIRGGSFIFRSGRVRCAVRLGSSPEDRGNSLGFRVLSSPLKNSHKA